jgi:glycerol-3-phosphate acyltransferase PlsY
MARLFGLGDLRQIGSGNIGATNVLRTGNKTAAALTLILDAGKGRHRCPDRPRAGRRGCRTGGGPCGVLRPLLSGVPWLRGGKGVATFLGTLLALFWPAGIAACLTWLLVAAVTRYLLAFGACGGRSSPLWAASSVARGGASVHPPRGADPWRHGENIARLRAGTGRRKS